MDAALAQRHRLLLESLRLALATHAEFRAELLPLGPDVPIPTVAVPLAPDARGRARVATLTCMPIGDDVLPGVDLVQCYIETPVTVPPAGLDAVRHLLTAVNLKAPLGAFSLLPDGELVQRFLFPVAEDPARHLPGAAFAEVFLLWAYSIDMLAPIVEQVGTGALSLAEALAQLDE